MTEDDRVELLEEERGSGGTRCSGVRPLLGFLNMHFWWYMGGLWLLCVIVAGGGYILPLLGACVWGLEGCEEYENANIQTLTGLFTAVNVYVFPGRALRMYSLWNKPGVSWSGASVPDASEERTLLEESFDPSSFYHFDLGTRASIVAMLVTSSLAQFVNQGFHIKYYSYGMANSWPGDLWNNVFFLLSLTTMLGGIVVEGFADRRVRASPSSPTFPPTASTLVMGRLDRYCCRSAD